MVLVEKNVKRKIMDLFSFTLYPAYTRFGKELSSSNILSTLLGKWRNSTLCFDLLTVRQNKHQYFLRAGTDPTTVALTEKRWAATRRWPHFLAHFHGVSHT